MLFSTNCKWSDIGSLEEYWKVNLESAKSFNKSNNDYVEIKPGIFVHKNTKLDKTLLNNINGNIVIGANCNIKSLANINGDVVIGNEVFIDDNANITNSVILNNTYVGKDVEIKDSVVNQKLSSECS